jgi:hypothetical protein
MRIPYKPAIHYPFEGKRRHAVAAAMGSYGARDGNRSDEEAIIPRE